MDFFLCKRGGETGKERFSANEKKLGEKCDVVFSFSVVVTGTELSFYFIHTAGKPRAYGIIKENLATAQNKKNKGNPPQGRIPTTNTPFLQSTAI